MSSSPPPEVTAARWRYPPGWSLRARLVAVMIGLLTVLGLVVGATAQVFLHKILYDQVDAQLHEAAQRALGGPPVRDGAVDPVERWSTLPPPGAPPGSIVLVLAAPAPGPTPGSGGYTVAGGGRVEYPPFSTGVSGSPLFGEYAPLPSPAQAALAQVPADATPTSVHLDGLGAYRVVSVPTPGGAIVTGLPLADTQETLLTVAAVTAVAVLAALLAAGWAGAIIVRRNLRPLERMAATATRVSEQRLDRGEVELAQRVPEGDTDPRTEVGRVGAALNRMLDHVGNALAARHASEMQVRQFVADASHELRTPLAAIRGYAELSRRSGEPVPEEVGHVLRRVESEAQRMTTLVEDLLLLARLDAGRPLAHDPVDVTALVVDAVSDAHAAGPRHDWRLEVPDEPVTVLGDSARLHQVLANLLANARTHTPEGTTVTVAVSATPDAAVLRVTDSGPGIPAELQPHIFERFARGDSSRSRAAGSTGLGLSIVYAVVTAHGGTVSVRSEPGRTEFTVRLPTTGAADCPDPT
ncbi:two-component system OmpR family sensor kinase [Krasilnikovia cinnamomea]|uniref:histidine kinase n=1 Tax=Krasilnikovia cinnamomea TaxID=349313 RepID=A0A4Q7ZLJ1_9ACTN|nr:HAMP domain-containing sensor histidine kinase [Krasilnikovia cinnamomea]RZU51842.1 two-component system OmpR family sensor kinase [Krasilnikovia cinnamomea]